ncbi:MAG: acetyl xylan esterase [Chitinophagaceae bacterium]|nr:acetyl xylan esterase [Chitinophagaceae bacterium]
MKKQIALLFFIIIVLQLQAQKNSDGRLNFFAANHPKIQYTGRIDFSNPLLPRFWQPGVYFKVSFVGSSCEVILNDEVLWGKNHNYLEVVVDGVAKRVQTRSARDTIVVADRMSKGIHSLLIYKNTEANIGYLELVGIRCKQLLRPQPKPLRKIECFGNSITCGTGSDMTAIPCGKGVWQDQHNACQSYGAITARALNAQCHLSAVSGIGLMHSCCEMDVIMPQVFDKVSMRNNEVLWDFNKYQPDVVTVCLGQNDGIQDSASFCNNYIAFIKTLRSRYSNATIVCLTSPMADEALTAFMKRMITSIVNKAKKSGDKKVTRYFFLKRYHNGCDSHPDLAEHRQIATELTAFIKKTMHW